MKTTPKYVLAIVAGISCLACLVFAVAKMNTGHDSPGHSPTETSGGAPIATDVLADTAQTAQPLQLGVAVDDEVGDSVGDAIQFDAPVRLKAGGKIIKTESPGYACPALVDLDNDGQKDLLVGQQNKGKINVYKSDGENFSSGSFLKIKNTQRMAMLKDVW